MDSRDCIEKEHIAQYEDERTVRWSMASEGEESAIIKICEIFSLILDVPRHKISHIRLDKIWFKKYDPTIIENEWVKGVSDFVVKILLAKEKYLLVEIKIKSKEFRKTAYGGKTTSGSKIPNYGCSSFYLDIDPVYNNINDFIMKTNKNFLSYILAFAKEDFSEINMISFAKIKRLIDKGWEKEGGVIPIGTYGEGYGRRAYLIPKDATINGINISKDQLVKMLIGDYPLPPP